MSKVYEMSKVYAAAAIATLILFGAAAASAAPPAVPPAAGSAILAASSIPPNCTMNPWTGKYTCHKIPPARLLTVMR